MMFKRVLKYVTLLMIGLLLIACGKKSDSADKKDSKQEKLYQVSISVESTENIFFSKYDVSVKVDKDKVGTIDHGSSAKFDLELSAGKHELRFEKEDDSSIDGTVTFDVTKNIDLSYRISSNRKQIKIEDLRAAKKEKSQEKSTDVTEKETKSEKIIVTTTTEATTAETIVKEKSVEEKLEEVVPVEMAERAVIVAATNASATDVFMEDRSTYDPAKFHTFNDISRFHMTVSQDGEWKAKDDRTWQVKNLLLKMSDNDTHVKVDADVQFDGNQYTLKSTTFIVGNKAKIERNDTNFLSIDKYDAPNERRPFLSVSADQVAQGR